MNQTLTSLNTTSNLILNTRKQPKLVIERNKNVNNMEVSWSILNLNENIIASYDIQYSGNLKRVDATTKSHRIPISTTNQSSRQSDGCLVVTITANFKEAVILERETGENEKLTNLVSHKLIKTDVNFPNISAAEEELLILILQRKANFLKEIEEVRQELISNSQNLERVRQFLGQENNSPNLLPSQYNYTDLFSTQEHQNYRNYIKLFNRNPSKGIVKLIETGYIKNNSPEVISEFLFNETSDPPLLKTAIGEFLGKKDSEPVLLNYVKLFKDHFQDQSLLTALRIFLDKFKLPGEAQQIDRIIQTFADSYVALNGNYLLEKVKNHKMPATPDAVYILTFSIIMLNTALHNPNVKNRMSNQDFIKMNQLSPSQSGSVSTDKDSKNDGSSEGNSASKPYIVEWTTSFLDKIYKEIQTSELKFPSQNTGWF